MKNSAKFHFWVWCLLKATHQRHRQLVGNQTIELEPGQFVFGRKAAATELGMSEQSVRSLINFFSEKDKKLTIKTTNKYSIISVMKYDSYLLDKNSINQQTNQVLTSNQPASNQQVTTNNNIDNIENNKNKRRRKTSSPNGEEYSQQFLVFWSFYPRKVKKPEAFTSWQKINPQNGLFEKILDAIDMQKQTVDWMKNGGQFIPYPATWLNGRRWEDEISEQPNLSEKNARNVRRYQQLMEEEENDKGNGGKGAPALISSLW